MATHKQKLQTAAFEHSLCFCDFLDYRTKFLIWWRLGTDDDVVDPLPHSHGSTPQPQAHLNSTESEAAGNDVSADQGPCAI
jgi:hypothetical protein